jgi:hypothetical protein
MIHTRTPQIGINYDTGFEPFGPNNSSRKHFDINVVREELRTFADYEKPHQQDSRHNLDMGSCGIVQVLEHRGKAYPVMKWEPRKVSWELAAKPHLRHYPRRPQ